MTPTTPDRDDLVMRALQAAGDLLAKLDTITTTAFARGGEREERERLRNLLTALAARPDWPAAPPAPDAGIPPRCRVQPTRADLPVGTPVWFWSRQETPGLWLLGVITANDGSKEGLDVYDVDVAGVDCWGYTWQVQPRTGSTEPPAPDLALTWP